VVGTGSVSHLSVERLMAQQNVRFTRINYNGLDQVVPALLSGDIDLFVLGPAAFGGHVAKGTVRVLVNGSERRGTTFPDAPTLKEAGLPPGLFVATRFTLFAPGSTPDALVARINQSSVSILQQPEMREKFLKAGLNVVSGDAGAEAKRLEEVAGPVEALVRSLKLSND
jgi:tripartite-type tricarboxylate transporter receptor subunit TctC